MDYKNTLAQNYDMKLASSWFSCEDSSVNQK